MTDEELKELIKNLIEGDRAKIESLIEAERVKTQNLIEADRAKTDRLIKAMNKQMGELSRKFGGYTEGLAMPAMERLLRRRFKMDVILPRARAYRNGRSLELDLLGYSRQERGDTYIVEIKSRFQEDSL